MTDTLLAVDKIETSYGLSQVLFGISLTIEAGEVVTLMGRNGMGKTTTVRSIMGLTRARAGSIRFAGDEIRHLPAYRVAKRGLGLVPEGRQIFPNLTTYENLVATATARQTAENPWTLDRVYALFPRLAERRDSAGNQLSGGEQQMLSIARALLTNPGVLLMDEPTEGLAPVIVEALTAVLARLRAESGLSIILVEQNSRVALEFSDRTVVLDKGRVVYDGPSATLRDDPERLTQLIGVSE
ncbi:MAG TPA: ABC transporter ATP-binding protein [Pseudolabrys sp.]|nr:ABC transporter ATP-binding protein [Pseudolabrys sp.]